MGKDSIVFNTALGNGNIDTLTDFTVADDTIKLENGIFTGLTSIGVLAANEFKVVGNGNQKDSDDHILYNTATGTVLYDADGSGAAGGPSVCHHRHRRGAHTGRFYRGLTLTGGYGWAPPVSAGSYGKRGLWLLEVFGRFKKLPIRHIHHG